MIEEALEEVEEASVIEGAEANSRVADAINTNLSICFSYLYLYFTVFNDDDIRDNVTSCDAPAVACDNSNKLYSFRISTKVLSFKLPQKLRKINPEVDDESEHQYHHYLSTCFSRYKLLL